MAQNLMQVLVLLGSAVDYYSSSSAFTPSSLASSSSSSSLSDGSTSSSSLSSCATDPVQITYDNAEVIVVYLLLVLYLLVCILVGKTLFIFLHHRRRTGGRLCGLGDGLPTKQSFLLFLFLSNFARIVYLVVWLALIPTAETVVIRKVLYFLEFLPVLLFFWAYIFLIYFWVLIYNTTALPIEIPEFMSARQAIANRKDDLKQLRFWSCLVIAAIQCLFFVAYWVGGPCNYWVRFADSTYYCIISFILAGLFVLYWWRFSNSLPDQALTVITERRVKIITWMTAACAASWVLHGLIDVGFNYPAFVMKAYDGSRASIALGVLYIIIDIIPSLLMLFIIQRLSASPAHKSNETKALLRDIREGGGSARGSINEMSEGEA